MSKFKTIITTVGAAKIAAVLAGTGSIILDSSARMAIGDGNGTLPTPVPSQTALVNEVYRAALNSASIDARDPKNIIAELIIPPDKGGFWMREMALYDAAGTLLAVGNMAETYKPSLSEGAGRKMVMRMVIAVSDVSAVTITMDTSTVMATQDYVDDEIDKHEKSRNHPDATLTAKGFTQLNSATNSAVETQAATPKAVKTVMDATNLKAPLVSPALTGTPTAPTAAPGTNTLQLANTQFVLAAIAALVNSSPGVLDTLGELAAALGNDANFATTMTTALALKAPLASPALTGSPTAPTAAAGNSTTQLATTAFVQAAALAIIGGAPATLDTLKEIATAINNDPNFSTTMTNALAGKQPKDNTLTNLSGKDVAGLLQYLGVPDLIPEAAPEPDVHIPFNDSLVMRTGFGPYDRINIGADYVEINSRSATLTRASTATYIDKSGVMQTAAINEPRFEKEGLLIEGTSTNLVLESTKTVSDTKFTKTVNDEWSTFLIVAADSTYNFVGPAPLAGAFAVGEVYTLSVWVTENTSTGPLRLRILDTPTNPQYYDYPAGYTGRLTITGTVTTAGTKLTPAIYVNGFAASPVGTKITVGRWQVEKLPFASSYIPTNGAAATRAADFWKIPNSGNIPADSKVSFALDFDSVVLGSTSNDYRNLFVVDGGRYVYFNPGNRGVSALANGSLPAFSLTPDGSVKAGVINTLAMSCDGTDTKSVINAGPVISKPNRLLNAPNFSASGTVYMDTGSSGIRALYGHIRNFRIWHRALTDAQLKSLR